MLLIGVWLMASVPALAQPLVNLTPGSSVMLSNGGPGFFGTPSPVTVNVNSTVKWRIRMEAEATGVDGPINPSAFTYLPDTGFTSPPGTYYDPSPQVLDSLKTIAYGFATNSAVARFTLRAVLPPLTKPGFVRGNIRVYVDNQGGTILQAFVFSFVMTMQPYVTVTLTGSDLSFSAGVPGNTIPSNTVQLTVTTNAPAGANVGLTLSQLIYGPNTIPLNRAAINYASTGAQALANAPSAPLGQGTLGQLNFTSPYGVHNYFIAGRVVTTVADAPGLYNGTLTASASVN